jgi:hypothetical protein
MGARSSMDESLFKQRCNPDLYRKGTEGWRPKFRSLFAYTKGSTRTKVCNQLFTSGKVSIQAGQTVTFFIVTLHQGGITSQGYVVLNR